MTPLILFVHRRPKHTRMTLDALRANTLASETPLFIYSDAARDSKEQVLVNEVRTSLRNQLGFKEVNVIERPHNFGLANNIIDGVTDVIERYGKVIVLEDDMVTSPYFLQYMNDALAFYQDDLNVASIHGYCYPTPQELPETFFLRGADCWGWATWQRAWQYFEADGLKLLRELKARQLTYAFDFDGSYPYTAMLKKQVRGKNNSWAIRWYASAFLRNMLTLYPGQSLVRNIGHDASGVHCEASNNYDVVFPPQNVCIKRQEIVECAVARNAFVDYFRSIQTTFPERVISYLRRQWQRLIKRYH